MAEHLVRIRDLHHTYLEGTPLAATALRGADLDLYRGEIAALIGPGGAGKTTLVHFINGLLRPGTGGHVVVLGEDTASPSCDLYTLRRQVGLVFQSPHHQMIERYVGDDIAHGPRQLGLEPTALQERVRWAMSAVGLDFEAFVDRHTFSLSGGEMRRVALAGVLALQPEILVLDEATTGLDPQGRRAIHQLLRTLRREQGLTILIVSNNMDEVATLADRVTVLYQGRTVMEGTPHEVFADPERLARYGLRAPTVTEIVATLRQKGVMGPEGVTTLDEAEEALWQAMTR